MDIKQLKSSSAYTVYMTTIKYAQWPGIDLMWYG